MPLFSRLQKHPTVALLVLMNVALLLIGVLTLGDTHLYWNPILHETGDDWLYYRAADWIRQGYLPYRDFALEYPPLAVVPFLVPQIFAGGHEVSFTVYCRLLMVENILLSNALALVLIETVRELTPRRDSVLAWYVAGVVILSPVLLWRYDLFPALLTLLALRAVQKDQPMLAGVWLGLGVAAKLYPVVFLPVLLAYYWFQKDRRAAWHLLAACLIAVIASALPFITAGPQMLSFLQYHQHRGIEVGSLAGGVIFIAHLVWRVPIFVISNYGAFHVLSPITDVLLAVIPWGAVVLMSVTALWTAQRLKSAAMLGGNIPFETVAACMTAMLLAFVVGNKVFSPQYLIWFLPLAALLPRREASALGMASIMTITLYPFCFVGLLQAAPWAVMLLNLRNLLMVGLMCHLFLSQYRAPLSSRYPLLPIIQGRKVLGRQP